MVRFAWIRMEFDELLCVTVIVCQYMGIVFITLGVILILMSNWAVPITGIWNSGLTGVRGLDCGLQSSLEALGTVGSNSAVLQVFHSAVVPIKKERLCCGYLVCLRALTECILADFCTKFLDSQSLNTFCLISNFLLLLSCKSRAYLGIIGSGGSGLCCGLSATSTM